MTKEVRVKKPWVEYFSIRSCSWWKSQEWEDGVRRILSISYDTPVQYLESSNTKWVAPILNWRIIIGPVAIYGYFLAGSISLKEG